MMTIITQVRIREGHEPAWDAVMRERIAAAKEHQGFVSVQVCIPADSMNERVIVGTWATRADWATWHSSEEFQRTRAQLEEPDSKTRREAWYEVVVSEPS